MMGQTGCAPVCTNTDGSSADVDSAVGPFPCAGASGEDVNGVTRLGLAG